MGNVAISSKRLVSSRATVSRRSGPQTSSRSASVAANRCGDSNITTGAGKAHQVRSQRWRATALGGGKPAKAKPGFSSVVTPLPISAAMTALGPGTGTTPKPAARTARTMRAPGSLTAGAPASDTRATRWPCAKRSQMAWAAAASLWRWAAMSGVLTPQASSNARLARVSSAAITSARCKACQARSPRSPRLPIGVATTYSVEAGQCCPATRSATRDQASPAGGGETF